CTGEVRVLREKSVAGMDGIGAGAARRPEDVLDGKIALRRRGAADRLRGIGERHVQRPGIRLRIDRDRLEAEPPAGTQYAAGDLAPVGNQDPLHVRVRSRGAARTAGVARTI